MFLSVLVNVYITGNLYYHTYCGGGWVGGWVGEHSRVREAVPKYRQTFLVQLNVIKIPHT